MKRLGRGIGLAAALALAAPGAAAASHAGPGDSPRDFAIGGGTNGPFQIGLSAHSDPGGANPSGYVSARSRPQSDDPVPGGFPVPFRFGGEVTCLLVHGNQASIKYRFDHADDPNLVGGGIQIFVKDLGEPAGGQSVDQTAFLPPMNEEAFGASKPEECVPPELGAYTPSKSGNIVVHEAE
jgi:hypothetical protein